MQKSQKNMKLCCKKANKTIVKYITTIESIFACI